MIGSMLAEIRQAGSQKIAVLEAFAAGRMPALPGCDSAVTGTAVPVIDPAVPVIDPAEPVTGTGESGLDAVVFDEDPVVVGDSAGSLAVDIIEHFVVTQAIQAVAGQVTSFFPQVSLSDD